MEEMSEKNGQPFSEDYAFDVIRGYSAVHRKGVRKWRLDKARVSRLEWLIDLLDLKDGDNVLEIGCGFGSVLFRIALRALRVTCLGIDISEECLVAGRRFFEKENLAGKVRLCHGTGVSIPCETASMDKVLLIDVLEHMNDDEKGRVLRDAFRVLKPDGILLINTPNLNYLLLAVKAKKIIRSIGFGDPSTVDVPLTPQSREPGDHVGLTDPAVLRGILEEEGFKSVASFRRAENIQGRFLHLLRFGISPAQDELVQTITFRCAKDNQGYDPVA